MPASSEPYRHSVSNSLLLLSAADYFAYLITDKNGSSVYDAQFEMAEASRLKQIIEEEPALKEVFARTELLSLDNDYILIPEAYALSGRMDLFRLNHRLDPLSQILRQSGTAWGAEVCYAFSAKVWQVLNQSFPGLNLNSDIALISDWLFRWPSLPEGKVLALYHSSRRMNAFVLNEDRTYELINPYDFVNMDEWFYYVMLILDQLGLKGEEISCLLMADEAFTEEAQSRLEPYVKEILPLHLIDETAAITEVSKRWIPLQMLMLR